MEHIGKILGLCRGIFWMAPDVKANKKRCRHLADRVKAMEELVEAIRDRGPGHISQNVSRALWKLSITLTEAHELVKKCAKTKFVNLVKSQSEFNSVNKGLRDTYHILAGAVQVDQRNMRHRILQDYASDDDDCDEGLGLPVALAPAYYPAAAVAAPRPQPSTALYAATVEIDNNTLYYAEAFFVAQ